MSTYVPYTPATSVGRAMFNFDSFGIANYKIAGVVRMSVSDTFSIADYLDPAYSFSSLLYTAGVNEVEWTTAMTDNIQSIVQGYSQFANIPFQWVGDFDVAPPGTDSTPNPDDVGRKGVADINISRINRSDLRFTGISGANSDGIFNYTGGAGDIFLNRYYLTDVTLGLFTRGAQVLMHELGHSLGLSHPHSAYNTTTGVPTITSDYAATQFLGFDQLGFRTASAVDMYKEYFSIMSYDDQLAGVVGHNAYTPMIFDVIALQQAYGEGIGTSSSGDDTIVAGTFGYRTYYDKGGTDTIDLQLYTVGAYLNIGVPITGADHLVGVSMSLYDAQQTVGYGGDPEHLRWFYGEFENALGSPQSDLIMGNTLSNYIAGNSGDDFLVGDAGNDSIEGGPGNAVIDGGPGDDTLYGGDGVDSVLGGAGIDTAVFTYDRGDYLVSKSPSGSCEVMSKAGVSDYIDADVEKMAFRDSTVAAASYKYYGTIDPVLAGSVSSVYRFFNTNDNAFFYTNSVAERNTVLANSDVSNNNVGEWPYVYQGSSFEASHSYTKAVPLQRFYNTVTHHHFFTSSATEAATVKANSASGAWPFVYEGVSFNVYASDPNPNGLGQEIAVERFYSAALNRHWFTADQTEITQIRLTGLWVDEGIGFWGEKPGA
jgi:Ca2+-binding RTX toxin-like protein